MRITTTILTTVFITIQLFSQLANLKFDRIGIEQGLSQSTVYAITQDKLGFMWFGTQDGLNRFDGYSMTIFKHNPNDSNSISDNTVLSLITDKTGELWIGTMHGGVNRYIPDENKFYKYRHSDADTNSISNDFVNCLFEDSNGDIWLGTFEKGLNRYNRKENSFTRIAIKEKTGRNSDNIIIWSICEDDSKNLMVSTSRGLYTLDINISQVDSKKSVTEQYLKPALEFEGLGGVNIHHFYIDKDKSYWGGIWGKGLSHYEGEKKSQIHYIHNNNPKSIASNYITMMLDDSKNNFWIATNEGGLNLYDRNSQTFSQCFEGSIMTLYCDRSGIVWIGTYTDGVKSFDWRKNQFKHVFDDPNGTDKLKGNLVMSILEDRDGELWVGTFDSGLNRFKKDHTRVEVYTFNQNDNSSISNNKIMALCESKDGSIWVGTDGGGLNRFDKRKGTFTRYKQKHGDENSISSNEISTLFEDRDGFLWIGFASTKIDRLQPSNNKITHFNTEDKNSPGFPGIAVNVFSQDKSGNMWIGTMTGGLLYLKAGEETFKKYLPIGNLSGKTGKSINAGTILSIYEDDKNTLWIGTNGGGLNHYDPDADSFTYYTMKDGLPNDVAYGILPDKSGNLWLSTNKGITRFDIRTKVFKNYDAKDGLQANEFNQGSYFVNQSGELFFGGINGFNAFVAEEIEDNNYIPPVYFSSFKVFDKPMDTHGSITTLKEIELSYFQNFFSFEFVALNFTSPEKNQYAYKLDGFDENWHFVNAQQRYGSYTNLDPGEYTLRVKGSNNDGIWNEAGTSIMIRITPPFWMTWWLRSLAIFAALSIALFFYKRRVKTLKRERELQQEFSHRLIEKQEEERSRIAQEMHDVLGQDLLFIKNRLLLTIQNDVKDNSNISENLTQISNNVSGVLKTVREISHNLRPPDLDQLGLTETIQSILFSMRESTAIKVSGNIENIDGLIPLELEINFVRIIQEAMGNIIKHAEATECNVEVLKIKDSIQLDIKDNGKGFINSNEHEVKKLFTGMGLPGMNERVRILGGTLKINSVPGNGTQIQIQIPVYNKTEDKSSS